MTDELSKILNRPLLIGKKTIPKRLVLAPMTVVGNIALRELISKFGGYGALFTEMCAAKRIPSENCKLSQYFKWRKEELPYLICQIVGNDPVEMAEAAKRIENESFFGVDINFGCTMSFICQQNFGAALLKHPKLAAEIVAAVKKAVTLPVSVKFRTGWEDNPAIAVDLAKRFEDAGADSLTFHPRAVQHRRSRPPKWHYIGLVKESVAIPVFGNGDVFNENDCLNMLLSSGCDGVAIGRIAVAKPWTFAVWADGYKPDQNIYLDTAQEMIKLLLKYYNHIQALHRFRKYSLYLSANFKYGHSLHANILKSKDMQTIQEILNDFFKNSPQLLASPNMNRFI